MSPFIKGALVGAVVLLLATGVVAVTFLKVSGLSARATPGPIETELARRARAFAVPAEYNARVNPVPATSESIRNGMQHFADHCASCHANDGSGESELGNGLFPPAPDMRATTTQSLSDGALFYFIEHGVRFTGMPAWSTGTAEGEESSWHLVNFIRHLPSLSPAELAEMAALNPRPAAEVRQEIEEQRFLDGADPLP
jgi:mono/diheme cytochrome c family protein